MSPEQSVPLLFADGVSAGYVPEVDIISDVHLVCEEGELVGIIGPNGAGKSTLVKTLFGLVDVRRGTVTFRGEDITSLPAHAMVERGVGYVPQVRNVFSMLSVEDNLRMGAYLAPSRFRERKEAVVELFPVLADRLGTQAGSLSGGQRQMLAMARALMTEPAVLLLDEPSAGLSPIMQDQVFDWIEGINDAGTAVVMV